MASASHHLRNQPTKHLDTRREGKLSILFIKDEEIKDFFNQLDNNYYYLLIYI